MIRFACPKCGRTLSAPDECAGLTGKCKCGQPVTIPRSSPGASGNPEKTALGEMIAHAPTNLPLQRTSGQPPSHGKKPAPQPNPEKTALGELTAHRPKGVNFSPPPTLPLLQNSMGSLGSPFSSPRSNGQMVMLLLLVFVSGVVIAAGLFWFLNSSPKKDPSEDVVAKGPKGDVPETPKKGSEQPGVRPDPKLGPEKKPDEFLKEKDQGKPAKKEEGGTPPVKPPLKVGLGKELDSLVEKLKKGSDEEKVKAAEALGKMGEIGHPIAHLLCINATNTTKDISRSSLQALEKVTPELYDPVFTLLVDGQAGNHLKAIKNLQNQGNKAKPAFPVIIFQVEKCRDDLKDQLEGV